jgi:uncharacterized damage-inducible protein DinB
MDDLRYPIGPLDAGVPILPEDRPGLVTQLAEAPQKLRAAVAGLSDFELEMPYRPGGWSLRQVVHHLADAHANWYIRTKLALTETNPTIKPFDEARWSELSDARTGPIEPSLLLFDSLSARWVLLFEFLDARDWKRTFQHPERGTLDLDGTLRDMAWHVRHHTAHITEFRKRERHFRRR